MASKRRNYENKKQKTTEIGTCTLPPFCDYEEKSPAASAGTGPALINKNMSGGMVTWPALFWSPAHFLAACPIHFVRPPYQPPTPIGTEKCGPNVTGSLQPFFTPGGIKDSSEFRRGRRFLASGSGPSPSTSLYPRLT
ncbi:hypothetical protein AAG570_013027 [Ranatra chinensis]|uniref:Uncharacterized protein n=1 Tax=Ranatra chinensis TaxID=642074 RepID=A0ABD0Z1T6_9HEMI